MPVINRSRSSARRVCARTCALPYNSLNPEWRLLMLSMSLLACRIDRHPVSVRARRPSLLPLRWGRRADGAKTLVGSAAARGSASTASRRETRSTPSTRLHRHPREDRERFKR